METDTSSKYSSFPVNSIELKSKSRRDKIIRSAAKVRFDSQPEAYNALKTFVINNSLSRNKIQKLKKPDVLQAVIKYILEETYGVFNSCPETVMKYMLSMETGNQVGKVLVNQFFKENTHLKDQAAAFEMYVKTQFPASLFGSPAPSSPVSIDSVFDLTPPAPLSTTEPVDLSSVSSPDHRLFSSDSIIVS